MSNTHIFAEERQNKILSLLRVRNKILVSNLCEEFGVSVVLAGGELRKGFSCTTGSITNNTLSSLKVDKIFLATNAVDSNGTLSTPDIEQAYVKKTMINMGKEIFLLCDSSKFGRQSFSRFGSISDIDYIITDTVFDPDILKDLNMNEITVITV